MPKPSPRQQLIQKVISTLEVEKEDEVLQIVLISLLSRRYVSPRGCYLSPEPGSRFTWIRDSFTSRSSFKFHFRMDEVTFFLLLEKLETVKYDLGLERCVVVRRPKVISFEIRLAAFLKMLGSSGNAASPIAVCDLLGIRIGSYYTAIREIRYLILQLKKSVLFWPNERERSQISRRIEDDFHLPNCLGAIDGTLFRFASKPAVPNAEDYYDRKCGYSINAIIVNDDCKRIRYIHVGWAGSVHDQRSFDSSDLAQQPRRFFLPGQYLTGDSAFTPSLSLVSVYKKPKAGALTEFQEAFNTVIGKFRVYSEHTIGILKGRWQFLKGIRMIFRNDQDYLIIIESIMCAVILHNLLIGDPENDIYLDLDEELDWPEENAGLSTLSPTQTALAFREDLMRRVLTAMNY